MNSYYILIIIDAITLLCAILLLRKRWSAISPDFIYLFFHIYAFSSRLWMLASGAPPLYWEQLAYRPVEMHEIMRAILLADAALIIFCFGYRLADKKSVQVGRVRSMRRDIVVRVSTVFLPIGVIFLGLSKGGGANFGEAMQFAQIGAMWPAAVLCLCLYRFGFRWYLVALLLIYLMLVGMQGYHRFMVAMPLYFCLALYLLREKKRWPGISVSVTSVLFLLLFPQLKYIGSAVSEGNMEVVGSRISQAFFLEEGDGSTSSTFLDQYAGALTLADDYGEIHYGSSYLAVLTLPIPRAIWPGKPGLGDHIIVMATDERPYDKEGRIITYIGESYLNFWYVGVFVIPALLGFWLGRLYRVSIMHGLGSLRMYVYLVVMMSLIQVYRDGLVSFVMFVLVQNIPMLAVVILHSVRWGRPLTIGFRH